MICYNDFYRLMLAAPECGTIDSFIAETGGSIPEEAVALLSMIYTAAHDGLTVRTIADAAGISMRRLSMTYGIPLRTIQDWSAGVRTPPVWQLPLIAYAVLSDCAAD